MHAFRCHVQEFLQLYGNIANFTQQGLEKYNDIVSNDFFRSSNHKGVSSTKANFAEKESNSVLGSNGVQKG